MAKAMHHAQGTASLSESDSKSQALCLLLAPLPPLSHLPCSQGETTMKVTGDCVR